MSQPIGRRLLAVTALVANGGALVLVVLSLFDDVAALALGLVCLGLASMAMYVALVSRGALRWITTTTSVVLALVVVIDLVVVADVLRAIALVALAAISVCATSVVLRQALTDRLRASILRAVSPAKRPVLEIGRAHV